LNGLNYLNGLNGFKMGEARWKFPKKSKS